MRAVFAMRGSIHLAKEDDILCHACCSFHTLSHEEEVRVVRALYLWLGTEKEGVECCQTYLPANSIEGIV